MATIIIVLVLTITGFLFEELHTGFNTALYFIHEGEFEDISRVAAVYTAHINTPNLVMILNDRRPRSPP